MPSSSSAVWRLKVPMSVFFVLMSDVANSDSILNVSPFLHLSLSSMDFLMKWCFKYACFVILITWRLLDKNAAPALSSNVWPGNHTKLNSVNNIWINYTSFAYFTKSSHSVSVVPLNIVPCLIMCQHTKHLPIVINVRPTFLHDSLQLLNSVSTRPRSL